MSIHNSVTPERIEAAARESMFGLGNPGICVSCGEEQEGCEPDARKYRCEACSEFAVYGAEELLFIIT
jgi:hypothetical protein